MVVVVVDEDEQDESVVSAALARSTTAGGVASVRDLSGRGVRAVRPACCCRGRGALLRRSCWRSGECCRWVGGVGR